MVHEHVKYFVLEKVTCEFDSHTMYFVIQPSGSLIVHPHHDLKFKWPLSMYQHCGSLVVLNLCCHTSMNPF